MKTSALIVIVTVWLILINTEVKMPEVQMKKEIIIIIIITVSSISFSRSVKGMVEGPNAMTHVILLAFMMMKKSLK